MRLSKRRQKVGQQPNNTRLIVRHRPLNANEFRMQRYREKQLEPPGEEDEDEEEEEEEEQEIQQEEKTDGKDMPVKGSLCIFANNREDSLLLYRSENFSDNRKICLQVPKQRTTENHALRREHPRGRPAESRDPTRDPVPNPARDRDQDRDRDRDQNQDLDPDQSRDQDRGQDHIRVLDHHPNLDRRLDRARVRRLNRAVNRDLDPAVLNQGTRRDRDPSRDRARERLRSHRRDLGRVRGPSPDRGQDRDLVPVAVAVPLARAAKAAPIASELRYMIENIRLSLTSFFPDIISEL